MEFLKDLQNIDDRLYLVTVTFLIIAAYIATRDPILGESMKYMLGALAGIFINRSQNKLIIPAGDDDTKKIVAEYLRG